MQALQFTLSLSFAFAQGFRKTPFTLSLSKGAMLHRSYFDKLSTNGIILRVHTIDDALIRNKAFTS